MKDFLYPKVKRASSLPTTNGFLCSIFFSFILLCSLRADAKTVIVGTGSGTVIQTSMSGLSSGDTLAIKAGTYSGAQFGGMDGVTITNSGGAVTFTGNVDFGNAGATLNNITFTGTGTPGVFYGFVFSASGGSFGGGPRNRGAEGVTLTSMHSENVRFDHMSFQNTLNGVCFQMSDNAWRQTYAGTTASLKLYRATFSYIRSDNWARFMLGGFGPSESNQGWWDSVTISHDTLTNTATNGNGFNGQYVSTLCTHFDIHHNYFLFTGGQNTIENDVGALVLSGSGSIHGNRVYGGRGYLVRMFGCSLSASPDDTWIYDNIKEATTKYGLADMRSDVTYYGTSGYVTGTNFHVIGNTAGNQLDMEPDNPYIVPIAVIYALTGSATVEVRGNLLFNSLPASSQSQYTGASMVDFSGTGRPDSSNNMYYTAAAAMTALADSVGLCQLKAASPLIGKGYASSMVTTDYSGRARPSPPSIGAQEYTAAANQPPTVSAGSNITITLPVSSVNLTGTATDILGISSYLWTQSSGPATASIATGSALSTSVTGLTVTGTYVFQLKVLDLLGLSSVASVTVTVNAAAAQPPTVSAGTAQTVTLPTSSVTLTGTATARTGGSISSYSWTQVSGPSTATIASAASASTAVSGLAAGTYVFQLKATDNTGLSATSTVTVTVNAAANQPPTANAGSAQTITLPTNSVSLNGTATDQTGTITTYLWTQVSGPNTSSIESASSASTTVNGLIAGTYVFQLKATDNNGLSGTSTVTLTVNAAADQAPVASAGSTQTITLPTNSVSLNGTATDQTGTITSYLWAQISGPSSATISNGTSANATAANLIAGTYVFELTVVDDANLSSTASVTITVNPADTTSKQSITISASARPSTVFVPRSSARLYANPQDANAANPVFGVKWTQQSGPNDAYIYRGYSYGARVYGLIAGTYTFAVTATDSNGTATATVTVNVIDTTNAAVSSMSNMDSIRKVAVMTTNADTEDDAADDSSAVIPATKNLMAGQSINLFPNPVLNTTTLQLKSLISGAVELYIYDINGRVIWMQTSSKPLSDLNMLLDFSKLRPGAYILKAVTAKKSQQSIKFIKQ